MVSACTAAANLGDLPTTDVTVGGETLHVWVADDAAERTQGLRGVTELPEGIDGMLFVHDRPSSVSFVMSDTLIPLDLWFFDPSGILVGGAEMTPCPAEPCTRYASPEPVVLVLETAHGDHVFERGDSILTSVSG
ncbi:MAG: DUF192 domain-containing protein [Acidimicrobiia bacterium]